MRYLALLRGINVGGNNKVPMSDLKACFEHAGFKNVMTYINSGNVLFDSDETSIEKLMIHCREILEQKFGFPIALAVIDSASLKDALSHAPEWWGSDPDAKHNAIFIIPPATAETVGTEVGIAKPEYEKISSYQNVVFWSAPVATFSRTRWSKIVGTKAYQDVTIRNSNTAKKLLELISK